MSARGFFRWKRSQYSGGMLVTTTNNHREPFAPPNFAHLPDIHDRSFTERRMNGKSFTNRYPWGGRDNEWEYRLQQRKMETPRVINNRE
jgi:hypothetical protein